jgi:hypothetical protein
VDDEPRSKIEEIIEEKVEKSLEQDADTKFSRLVDKKIDQKLREKEAEGAESMDADREMNRRSFLKMLGLGGAGIGLASSATAASLLQGTTVDGNIVFHEGNDFDGDGSSDTALDADTVDGSNITDIGDSFVDESGDEMTGRLDINPDPDSSPALTADDAAFGVSQTTGQSELSDSTVYVGGNIEVKDDILGRGGDLAEKVNCSDELEQGEVAVISGDMSLERSTKAYDTAVAGVISTDPGIVLAKERGGKNLGLSGIVPVKVTADNGKIEAGDVLTPSNTPGTAMKCRDHDRCENAVIGKAMQPAEEDGKIRVLLTMG